MNFILFDGPYRNALLPFTYTRPVADIRVGILTVREKWETYLGSTITTVTEQYLSDKFPMVESFENVMINGAYLPNHDLVEMILNLSKNEAIFQDQVAVAYKVTKDQKSINFKDFKIKICPDSVMSIKNTWDIFRLNGKAIELDFSLITKGRKSQVIPQGVNLINESSVFIEKGAEVSFSSLNASGGPIYIGKNSNVMEGCLIRGPFALCENSILKMGSKIYGSTTIGPYCKLGGEINNSVFLGYSNKAHDGFLGNSVIGEWCNLGANTNNSNLKNNYAEVRLWNYENEKFKNTGLKFCGLFMGDHSKCGINTMFNTGTTVGVSCNIFGSGFPRNFIPSFSWGGRNGFSTFKIEKALEVAEMVMDRRGVVLTETDTDILKHIFKKSENLRSF